MDGEKTVKGRDGRKKGEGYMDGEKDDKRIPRPEKRETAGKGSLITLLESRRDEAVMITVSFGEGTDAVGKG